MPTNTRTHRSRHAAGFTLVEMLGAFTIMLILFALLMPMLLEGRERALDIKCQFNIRNMGLAMVSYANDHKNKFSQWNQTFRGNYYDTGANATGNYWTQDPMTWPITKSDIFPYTRSHAVYVCPLYDRFTAEPAAWTYTQNWECGPTGGWGSAPVERTIQVNMPAQFALFAEETPWVHGFTAVQAAGAWDVSDGGHYSKYAMNDARIVTDSDGWPKIDGMATHHRPLPSRYNYSMIKNSGQELGPYQPTSPEDVEMNTGVSNVVFADGHVEAVETTKSDRVMHNRIEDVRWARKN